MFGCGCRSGMLYLAWLSIYLIFYIVRFYVGRGVACDNVEVLCDLDELLKLEGKCVVGWGVV